MWKKIRSKLIYWMGIKSPQIRENYYRNTGLWLWGLKSFAESRRPGPRECSPISSGEWKALMEDVFQSN